MLAMRAKYQKEKDAKGISSEEIFAKKGEISSEMRNIGVAFGWGALAKKGAVYPSITIPESGECLMLTLKDFPMADNAFWSVTVYDKDGFAQGDNYNINSSFAKKGDEGSYQFLERFNKRKFSGNLPWFKRHVADLSSARALLLWKLENPRNALCSRY